MPARKAEIERFTEKVDMRGTDECWEWTAGKNAGGYGIFWPARNRGVYAHRYAYELWAGPIGRHQLDHLCRNRSCVNPRHLEPTTNRENLIRGEGFPGVNHRKTHCPQGHAYDAENTYVYVYKDGLKTIRYCRACHRKHERDRARRKKAAA